MRRLFSYLTSRAFLWGCLFGLVVSTVSVVLTNFHYTAHFDRESFGITVCNR
jgi:hypothetical protein